MVYDSLLILALLFLAVGIVVAFNGGEAVAPNAAFKLYLMFVVFTFYAWFWRKSGQTLGMRAWKIRIVSEFGGNPSWGVAYLRLVFAVLSMACLGLGYWWRLFKPYTWHDRLSQTRIVHVPSTPATEQGEVPLAPEQEPESEPEKQQTGQRSDQ